MTGPQDRTPDDWIPDVPSVEDRRPEDAVPPRLAEIPDTIAPLYPVRDRIPCPPTVRISFWLWWLGTAVWLLSVFVGTTVNRAALGSVGLDLVFTALWAWMIIAMRRGSGTARVLLTIATFCAIVIFGWAIGIAAHGDVGKNVHPIVEIPLWVMLIVVIVTAVVFMHRRAGPWFR